jgi:hypothetical protein
VTLLRLWLAASAIVFAGLLVWAFAPVLLLLMLVTAGLGAVVAIMLALARRLQAWREHRGG